MDCKEAEKNIPSFLLDELEGRELAEFVEHIEGCFDCREELTIQFLVAEGMERLEAGDNFNLQKALMTKMDGARHRIRVNRTLRNALTYLEITVAVAIVVSICIVLGL